MQRVTELEEDINNKQKTLNAIHEDRRIANLRMSHMAKRFLSDIAEAWLYTDIVGRKCLQRLLFTEGIIFFEGEGFVNTKITL